MLPNQKYINEWLSERSLELNESFSSQLKTYADLYGKNII